MTPWAGAPRLDDPSLLVDRALSSGYDPKLAKSLQAWEARDANEALFPFALGTLRRRGGDLDGAFERVQGTDAEVVQEPTEQPYGVRDCAFRDPAGNLVRIQQLR